MQMQHYLVFKWNLFLFPKPFHAMENGQYISKEIIDDSLADLNSELSTFTTNQFESELEFKIFSHYID